MANTTKHLVSDIWKWLQNENETVYKSPCNSATTTVMEHEDKKENGEEPDSYLLSMYYETLQNTVIKEVDLMNNFELFGLFCGAIGLFFGATVIELFELLFEMIEKGMKSDKSISKYLNSLLAYSLKKFETRYKHYFHVENEEAEKVERKKTPGEQNIPEAGPL